VSSNLTSSGEFKRGERRGERLERIVRDALGGGELAIDYVAAVDALTLAEVASITAPAVLAVAARAGATRLIDNVILMP
jgi:pantoate--beta-alanine ligase